VLAEHWSTATGCSCDRMLPCSTAAWSKQRDHFQARLALVEPTQQAPPKQRRSSG
jgi:hypothetical protein